MAVTTYDEVSWERMTKAVERVRRNLIEVGLVDESWSTRIPESLRSRRN